MSAAHDRAVAIVQARMSSTRLPGKVMKKLGDRTVLAHCLERCAAIPGIDQVVCATVDTPDCDPVAAEADRLGIAVFRGDESDVLSRYVGAAEMAGADIVLRVTSDCPTTDPAVCGAVLAALRSEDADFATNNAPPSFPHGLDVEVVRADVLTAALAGNPDAHAREHVMPAVRRNPELRRINLHAPAESAAPDLRWTLDTPQDLAFFEALERAMPGLPVVDWQALARTCRGDAQLAALCLHGAADTRHHASDGFRQIAARPGG